jgi:hypothetical protein
VPGGARAATRNVSAVPAAALPAHSSDRRLCVCVASPGMCTSVGAGTYLAARRVRDHRQQRATHADGAHNDAQRQKRRERHPSPPVLRLSIVSFFANFAPVWAPHQSMPTRVSRFEDLKIRFPNGRSLSLSSRRRAPNSTTERGGGRARSDEHGPCEPLPPPAPASGPHAAPRSELLASLSLPIAHRQTASLLITAEHAQRGLASRAR